jgi:hypothetical protein
MTRKSFVGCPDCEYESAALVTPSGEFVTPREGCPDCGDVEFSELATGDLERLSAFAYWVGDDERT